MSKARKRKRTLRWVPGFKTGFRAFRSYRYAALALVALAALSWGVYRGVRYAQETEQLEIKRISALGLHRISENEVLGRVGFVPGINVLSLDLRETREAVEEIQWVRHATVQRVWPGEIVIYVVEREPVALARVDSELFQIDIEGVLLAPDALTRTDSPILEGLRAGDVAGNEIKVAIYLDIVETIGEGALSEVHVADSGEVSVVPIENPILVDLGLTDHNERWRKYVGLSDRIREEYPDALRVDLRFRDQVIIQTRKDEPSGNILWGEETKLL